MKIQEGKVFNLMDTNGRRADVLNALFTYLSILKKLGVSKKKPWDNLPKSSIQYRFYQEAINASPDIFKSHPKFDADNEQIKEKLTFFDEGNPAYLKELLNKNLDLARSIDVDIESRARHYSSNLVKLGFVNGDRTITESGEDLLGDTFHKDTIEEILPLNGSNISVLRQLLKLRIYDNEGLRFYSPFRFGLYILLRNDVYSQDDFLSLIQMTSPHQAESDPDSIISSYLATKTPMLKYETPEAFKKSSFIGWGDFSNDIKNTKSSKAVKIYYDFYKALYEFDEKPSDANLAKLANVMFSDTNEEKIRKAFGHGSKPFELDRTSVGYGFESFLMQNDGNDLLSLSTLNASLYRRYRESKYEDTAREYADTTRRIFGATGVVSFDKGLVRLRYKEVFAELLNAQELKQSIFGIGTEQDYETYEGENNDEASFGKSTSIMQILGLSEEQADHICLALSSKLGGVDLKKNIEKKANSDFVNHVKEKYSKQKVIDILNLFSDRKNDVTIKEMVNPEATVPTIYEYMVALAWYYISGETIDLYDSVRLTLNSDFEPILHAGGGDGDIIIQENDRVVMMEVTLMDPGSQKQGELEPVKRHSTNLKARSKGKDALTFFFADDLDFNTFTDWRWVAFMPQFPANSKEPIEGVKIMAFTNAELSEFLQKNISENRICEVVNKEFSTDKKPEFGWRKRVVGEIFSQQ